MKQVIREMSWFKRRRPTKEIQPIEVVSIDDLQFINNHYTEMRVKYDDGETYELSGRVYQNDINKKWALQGLNGQKGLSVVVDFVEE